MALRRRSLRLRTWWCRAFIGTFVIPYTRRWCVPLWDRHCSSAVSCFSSTRALCVSCLTCSCWARRNPHSGGSLVPHTRHTERTSRGGGRGSHRGRAPAKNDRLSGRGISSVDVVTETPIVWRFSADEWRVYRDLRLRALADSPDAFGSTLAEETDRPDAEWARRLASGADSETNLPVVAEVQGGPIGLAWGRIDTCRLLCSRFRRCRRLDELRPRDLEPLPSHCYSGG